MLEVLIPAGGAPSPNGAAKPANAAPNAPSPPPSESAGGNGGKHAQAPTLSQQLGVAVRLDGRLGTLARGLASAGVEQRAGATRLGGKPVDRAQSGGEVAVWRDPLVGKVGAWFGALGVAGHGKRRRP